MASEERELSPSASSAAAFVTVGRGPGLPALFLIHGGALGLLARLCSSRTALLVVVPSASLKQYS